MGRYSGLFAGAVAGVLCAGVWSAIAYYMRVEIGWLALLVGVVVGGATRAGAKEEDVGVLSATLAAVSILLGKLLCAAFLASHLVGQFMNSAAVFTDEALISGLADQVVLEFDRDRRDYTFPNGVDPADASQREDYPREVWRVAQERWEAMTEQEQEDLRACPILANPDVHVSEIADRIAQERTDQGEALKWPKGFDAASAERSWHYPKDVWQSAANEWSAKSDAEKEQAKADKIARYSEMMQGMRGAASRYVTWTAFKANMGALDVIFIVFAIAAAYKVGEGLSG